MLVLLVIMITLTVKVELFSKYTPHQKLLRYTILCKASIEYNTRTQYSPCTKDTLLKIISYLLRILPIKLHSKIKAT